MDGLYTEMVYLSADSHPFRYCDRPEVKFMTLHGLNRKSNAPPPPPSQQFSTQCSDDAEAQKKSAKMS